MSLPARRRGWLALAALVALAACAPPLHDGVVISVDPDVEQVQVLVDGESVDSRLPRRVDADAEIVVSRFWTPLDELLVEPGDVVRIRRPAIDPSAALGPDGALRQVLDDSDPLEAVFLDPTTEIDPSVVAIDAPLGTATWLALELELDLAEADDHGFLLSGLDALEQLSEAPVPDDLAGARLLAPGDPDVADALEDGRIELPADGAARVALRAELAALGAGPADARTATRGRLQAATTPSGMAVHAADGEPQDAPRIEGSAAQTRAAAQFVGLHRLDDGCVLLDAAGSYRVCRDDDSRGADGRGALGPPDGAWEVSADGIVLRSLTGSFFVLDLAPVEAP